jgi:hypothetical protein
VFLETSDDGQSPETMIIPTTRPLSEAFRIYQHKLCLQTLSQKAVIFKNLDLTFLEA